MSLVGLVGFPIVIKPASSSKPTNQPTIHCYQRRDSEIWIGMKMNIPRKSSNNIQSQLRCSLVLFVCRVRTYITRVSTQQESSLFKMKTKGWLLNLVYLFMAIKWCKEFLQYSLWYYFLIWKRHAAAKVGQVKRSSLRHCCFLSVGCLSGIKTRNYWPINTRHNDNSLWA